MGPSSRWRCSEPGRKQSTFIDPADPDARRSCGSAPWRTLDRVWVGAPHWENFGKVWDLIDYPRLLFNTIAIAVIGTIGTLLSCTLVAYGFARFKFPGRGLLFTLLIATIFLPGAVTIIPTYTIFVKLGWVGTWLPLLVPAFFANAYDVFLMRQYFMTIPTEMDEAAAIDGAGPFRTLWSVLLPQCWPVVIAVAIFHLVYSWNDFFAPVLYLVRDARPPDAGPRAGALQRHPLPRAGPRPGGHAHDPDHPGHRVPADPALLHPRPRRHRRRQVTAVARVAVPRRADLRRRASTTGPPTPAPARRCSTSLTALDVRATCFIQGRWAEAYPGDGPLDRGGRASRRQPLPLPCPDAAADRRRARGGPDEAGRVILRDHRRRPSTVVPLPVRGRAPTIRASRRPSGPRATGTSAGTSASRTGSRRSPRR